MPPRNGCLVVHLGLWVLSLFLSLFLSLSFFLSYSLSLSFSLSYETSWDSKSWTKGSNPKSEPAKIYSSVEKLQCIFGALFDDQMWQKRPFLANLNVFENLPENIRNARAISVPYTQISVFEKFRIPEIPHLVIPVRELNDDKSEELRFLYILFSMFH